MRNSFSKHTNVLNPLGKEIDNLQDRQDVLHCLLLFHWWLCKFSSIFILCSVFFPIAVDISEDPNCPPKHREAWAEKLYFVLFVKSRKHQNIVTQIPEMWLSPASALATFVTLISSPGTDSLMAAEQEQCQMAPESPGSFFSWDTLCQSHLKIQISAGCTLISGGSSRLVDTLNKTPPGHIHIIIPLRNLNLWESVYH